MSKKKITSAHFNVILNQYIQLYINFHSITSKIDDNTWMRIHLNYSFIVHSLNLQKFKFNTNVEKLIICIKNLDLNQNINLDFFDFNRDILFSKKDKSHTKEEWTKEITNLFKKFSSIKELLKLKNNSKEENQYFSRIFENKIDLFDKKEYIIKLKKELAFQSGDFFVFNNVFGFCIKKVNMTSYGKSIIENPYPSSSGRMYLQTTPYSLIKIRSNSLIELKNNSKYLGKGFFNKKDDVYTKKMNEFLNTKSK